MENTWGVQLGDHVEVTPNKPKTHGPASGIVTALRPDGCDVFFEAANVGGVLRQSVKTGVLPPGVLTCPVSWEDVGSLKRRPPTVFVRRYAGSQTGTTSAFQEESAILGPAGYAPSSQQYTPGNWGCGEPYWV